MDKTLTATLERLESALSEAAAAQKVADSRVESATARIAEADARIADAVQQTAHAASGMAAAQAHMKSAAAHMADAVTRTEDADRRGRLVDEHEELLLLRTNEASRLATVASVDSEEYRRALYHYQQIVRHRIANPLQVIRGMAQTLLERRDLGPEKRKEMIEAIAVAAELLERVTLFVASQQGAEEAELNPAPYELGPAPPSTDQSVEPGPLPSTAEFSAEVQARAKRLRRL